MNRGFTLVEMLASLAIMAAIVAVLGGSLRGSAIAAQWHRAFGDVRHLDQLARLRARTDGPMLVSRTEDGRAVRATRQRDALLIAEIELPRGIAASIIVGDRAETLVIDGSGRSVDAAYLLVGSARTVRIGVNGLTGQHERTEAKP